MKIKAYLERVIDHFLAPKYDKHFLSGHQIGFRIGYSAGYKDGRGHKPKMEFK